MVGAKEDESTRGSLQAPPWMYITQVPSRIGMAEGSGISAPEARGIQTSTFCRALASVVYGTRCLCRTWSVPEASSDDIFSHGMEAQGLEAITELSSLGVEIARGFMDHKPTSNSILWIIRTIDRHQIS